MNKDQKTVTFAIVLSGALGTLWYFSHRNSATPPPDTMAQETADVAATGTPTTINIPPIAIPPITTPPIVPPTLSGCCRNCGGSSFVSNNSNLTNTQVTPQIATNTAAPSVPPTTKATMPSVNTTGLFEPLLEGNNGALPRPNPVLWTRDPLYRLAYVLSWNDNVQKANDMCWNDWAHAYSCHLGTLDDSLANSADLTAIENATAGSATAILKSNPGDPLYSDMMSSMSVYLAQLGDTSINSGSPTQSNPIGANLIPL